MATASMPNTLMLVATTIYGFVGQLIMGKIGGPQQALKTLQPLESQLLSLAGEVEALEQKVLELDIDADDLERRSMVMGWALCYDDMASNAISTRDTVMSMRDHENTELAVCARRCMKNADVLLAVLRSAADSCRYVATYDPNEEDAADVAAVEAVKGEPTVSLRSLLPSLGV